MRRFLQAVKLTAGCIDCGYNEYAVALDFDHRDPTTKQFNLSRGSKKLNWAQVIEELMKCDVRCANCHRVKSYPGEVK